MRPGPGNATSFARPHPRGTNDARGAKHLNATTLFVLGIFLLVGCSVLVGELFIRIGQVALVGQLLVGVILGPTLLAGPLGIGGIATEFQSLQFLATFFILMMAGMAITPQQIRATGVSASILGLSIFLIPFVVGAEVVHLLYPALSGNLDLFVSLTIAITALPVLGVMLRELNLLESRFGSFLMNTAMVNELAAVTTLSVLLQIHNHPGTVWVSITTAVLTTSLFLTSILAVHFLLRTLRQIQVWDRWVVRFRESWRTREAGFAILMVIGFGAALFSEYLGLTYLVGAFYCGLLITPETAGRREHRSISFIFEAITWGFFIPLFFALVGFDMNLRLIGLAEVPIIAFFALGIFAVFSKLFVGAAVSRALGWPANDSLASGFLVMSRGGVALAMAVILLSDGIFSTQVFTIVAGVSLLTTFISPIGAKPFVRSMVRGSRPADEVSPPGALEPTFSPGRTTDR